MRHPGLRCRQLACGASLGVLLYTRVMGNLAQAAAELLSGDLATGSGEKPSTSVASPWPAPRENGPSDYRCLNARVYFWLDFTRLSRQ